MMNTQNSLTLREQSIAQLARKKLEQLEKHTILTCKNCNSTHDDVSSRLVEKILTHDIGAFLKRQNIYSHQVRKIRSSMSQDIKFSAVAIYQRHLQNPAFADSAPGKGGKS